jgi:hypothetical protein
VHQLAVLSIGWAAFLHPVRNPVLTQHCATVNLFGLLTFDPFCFFGCFFLNPDHTTLQPNHPGSLATLLTYYIIDLHLHSTCRPLTYLLSIFSWLNLYLLAKLFSFGTTFNIFWPNLYFLAKPFFLAQLLTFLDYTFISWLNLFLFAQLLVLLGYTSISWLNIFFLAQF